MGGAPRGGRRSSAVAGRARRPLLWMPNMTRVVRACRARRPGSRARMAETPGSSSDGASRTVPIRRADPADLLERVRANDREAWGRPSGSTGRWSSSGAAAPGSRRPTPRTWPRRSSRQPPAAWRRINRDRPGGRSKQLARGIARYQALMHFRRNKGRAPRRGGLGGPPPALPPRAARPGRPTAESRRGGRRRARGNRPRSASSTSGP